jgi:hypothetical protein
MAEKAKSRTFKIIPPPPGMEFVGPGQQIHLRLNVGPLKEIFVYYDPLDDGGPEHKRGYVRFYPASEHRPIAQLVYSWFPPGTWKVKFSEPNQSGAFYATSIEPGWTNADEKVVAAFKERLKSLDLAIGWEFTSLPKSKKSIAMQKAEVTEAVRSAAEKGREVLLKVAYDRSDGDIRSLLTSEPVHGDASYLLDEPLARIFLEFVEHFGNIEVDHGLARGGLTDEKLKKVREPNPAVVDAITNLFTQGYGEFEWSRRSAQPTPSIEDFKRMEEAIFFQARVRNDLARRNLLRIGIGFVQDKKGKREDIGVVRRPCVSGLACEGAPRWLLYDRHGVAVMRAGSTFRDLEYRSVDLEKLKREAVFPVPVPGVPGLLVVRGVPIVEIDVQDRNIYGFLRALEQSLGGPPRELVALASSLFNHGLFIAREMHKRNKAWVLAGRTIEFAAGVFIFFVIHAIAAFLKASPHPAMKAASYLVMAMARAVGALLGVDLALTNMEKLALAGRHFAQMEQLHRESSTDSPGSAPGRSSGEQAGSKDPVEIPRLEEAKLTKLSRGHLEAGAEALLDAMADYFALGVVLVGGVGVAKLRRMRAAAKEAKALQENIKSLEADAHSKLKISDDGAVEEIEPLKSTDKLEGVPVPKPGKPAKPTGGLGAEKPPADGKPKPEKRKPQYGEYFYKRCDALKKRVETLKEHLDSLEMPSDSGRSQRLEELKTKKATFLLNSIELVRDSKGERMMPVLSKEVAEYEAEVAKEFPRPMPEEPPRDSEGLYVIQEPGELQGEPQRGRVPEPGGTSPSDFAAECLKEILEIRSRLQPRKIRTAGNIGLLKSKIPGLESLRAHSAISEPADVGVNVGFVLRKKVGRRFSTSRINRQGEVDGENAFDRSIDTESKLLERAADVLIEAPDARGTLKLFSGYPPCRSCRGVVEQFRAQFKGRITLEVYDEKGGQW